MPFEPKLRFLKIIWRVISFFLGGACYIHLTMGTNAVFSGFSAFSVTATNFMNSITFVMNHLISYFDISICHCSNRTLCYHLFKFHGFNYGYFLGGPRYIHLTKGTNAVFSGFSAFLAPAAMFMNPITCVMNCLSYYILILVFLQTLKSCYVSLNGLHLVAP